MAGLPWFELDVDMPDDPKCISLGDRLHNPLAFGYVVRLYAYCYRHATDRFEGHAAASTIEGAAGWKGKRGALLEALLAERFVDPDGSTMVVHGVAERLGPHLAKQTRDRERMRERRANVARTSPLQPRDVPGDKDKDKDTDKKKQLLPSTNAAEPGAEAPPSQGSGATVHPIRKRAAPKPVDPRHRPLQLALEAAFRQARGSDYGFQKKDARAITGILALSRGDQAEAVRRFLLGLGSDFKLRCDTIWDLEQKWNSLTTNGATSAVQPSRPVLS